MTEVKFTTPVTDKNTGELYLKDKVKEFEDARAQELIAAGVAEIVTKGKPTTKEEKNFQ